MHGKSPTSEHNFREKHTAITGNIHQLHYNVMLPNTSDCIMPGDTDISASCKQKVKIYLVSLGMDLSPLWNWIK